MLLVENLKLHKCLTLYFRWVALVCRALLVWRGICISLWVAWEVRGGSWDWGWLALSWVEVNSPAALGAYAVEGRRWWQQSRWEALKKEEGAMVTWALQGQWGGGRSGQTWEMFTEEIQQALLMDWMGAGSQTRWLLVCSAWAQWVKGGAVCWDGRGLGYVH